MNNLEYIKSKFEGSFDVKYRKLSTILGNGTLVFIDDLASAQWMMEYMILPLRGFGELKGAKINTPMDLIDKVLDMNMTGIAKDNDDAIFHVLSGDVILVLDDFNEIVYFVAKNIV